MQNYHPRLNNYHSHKQNVLGNQGARPAPAWKPNARAASGSGSEIGSKILLSRLPIDVVEDEVETLFSRTVGPVKEVLMVYNSQAKSRGMAIVSFTRPGDAAVARAKYNGKIVDGRRPIKIEIITDDDDARKPAPAPAPAPPSLLNRLSPPTPAQAAAAAGAPLVNGQKKGAAAAATAAPVPGKVRLRTKKGPRRLNKQRGQQQAAQQQQTRQKPKPKTAEELDAEMDDYRAHG